MNTLLSVLNDFRSYFSIKNTHGRVRLLALFILVGAAAFFLWPSADTQSLQVRQVRAVLVAPVYSFSDSVSAQLIGTVSSVDQADIQSETSGRATSVEVSLGQNISAGQVIARLEGASQYAAVLQAEGAYEGALASAQISDISVSDAGNTITSAYNSAYSAYATAYSTLQDIYQKDLDLLVADPNNTFRTPGASLRSNSALISEVDSQYKNLGILFARPIVSESSVDGVSALLLDAQSASNSMLKLIRNLRFLIDDGDVKTAYATTELSYLSTLSSAQLKIDSTLLSLKTAEVTLSAAKKSLEKTQVGGTQATVSSANAQIKQALGSLRAAQANYNKTVLRSPIAGVVNAINIKTGDYVSGFQTVAEIANNNALEITTFIGESDRELIAVQQEVLIEGKIPGIVSTIAPAVNPSTGKIEVRIQSTSPDLINGDTVTIALGVQRDADVSSTIQIPLTAVKFTATAGSVFTVVDEKLVANLVEIGPVRDTYIEIVSGLTSDMEIVVDARGLSEGESVTSVSN